MGASDLSCFIIHSDNAAQDQCDMRDCLVITWFNILFQKNDRELQFRWNKGSLL